MTKTAEEIADEKKRDSQKVLKLDVLNTLKQTFEQAHETLKGRTQQDQNIIGNMLTTLELELKKDIKALPPQA